MRSSPTKAKAPAAALALPTVAAIEAMEREALLALWGRLVPAQPPPKISMPFLRRILAFEVQARACGGLPAALRQRIARLGDPGARPATPQLKGGGRYLREWNGTTHVVDVVDGGLLWQGRTWRSLSVIAREITGAHWSGPRFFGLQQAGSSPRKAGRRVPA